VPHTFSCVSNRADLGLLLTSEEGGKREDERERERTSVRVELGPSKGLNLKGKLRRENQLNIEDNTSAYPTQQGAEREREGEKNKRHGKRKEKRSTSLYTKVWCDLLGQVGLSCESTITTKSYAKAEL